MKPSARLILHWTPRILCALFTIFLSLFALDVFDERLGFWPTTVALLMHLIPSAVMLVVLVLAWRWPWAGALCLTAGGVLYWMSASNHPNWVLSISLPLFFIAALFLLDWRLSRNP